MHCQKENIIIQMKKIRCSIFFFDGVINIRINSDTFHKIEVLMNIKQNFKGNNSAIKKG